MKNSGMVFTTLLFYDIIIIIFASSLMSLTEGNTGQSVGFCFRHRPPEAPSELTNVGQILAQFTG